MVVVVVCKLTYSPAGVPLVLLRLNELLNPES